MCVMIVEITLTKENFLGSWWSSYDNCFSTDLSVLVLKSIHSLLFQSRQQYFV